MLGINKKIYNKIMAAITMGTIVATLVPQVTSVKANEMKKIESVNIDGILDDIIWERSHEFSYGDSNNVNVKAYMAEENMLLGFDVKDNNIFSESSIIWENDGVEILIDPLNNGMGSPRKDDIQILLDVTGNKRFANGKNENGSWSTSSLNIESNMSLSEEGYCIEVAIPYSELGLKGKPEQEIGIGFGAVNAADGKQRVWYGSHNGLDTNVPTTFMNLGNLGFNSTEKYYKNPGNIHLIADPCVILASDGYYYAYGTSDKIQTEGVLVWRSKNLNDWEEVGEAYRPDSDNWAVGGIWAPEVLEYEGKYYMYYTAKAKSSDRLDIALAVSDSPIGPFKDVTKGPLLNLGYSIIDAFVLVEDGQKYLYYTRDCSENEVNGRRESHLYVVGLEDDMMTTKGDHVKVTMPEQDWELGSGNPVWNEGPQVYKLDGKYYLMYSGNCYDSRKYSIGYAVSDNPMGPFNKYEGNPLISTSELLPEISGPGHHSVVKSPDGKELYAAYHTHMEPSEAGWKRQISIDKLGLRQDGTMYVNGPTNTIQPMPSGSTAYQNLGVYTNVNAVGTKDSYNPERINDGEITVHPKFKKHEWVTNGGEVTLAFDNEQEVADILLYGSVVETRNKIDSLKITLSDGTAKELSNITLKAGEAYKINIGNSKSKDIKLEIKNQSSEVGISEVMIIGKYDKDLNNMNIPLAEDKSDSSGDGGDENEKPDFSDLKAKIDGKLDEYIWKQTSSVKFGRYDDVEAKTVIDEKGIYFGINIKDENLWGNKESIWDNDGIEIVLDPQGDKSTSKKSDDFEFRYSINGKVEVLRPNIYGQTEVVEIEQLSAVNINGTLNDNSDNDSHFTIEAYVPWSELGVEIKETMGISFGRPNRFNDDHKEWYSVLDQDLSKPMTYYRLNKFGINKAEKPSEIALDGNISEKQWNDAYTANYGINEENDTIVKSFIGNNGVYFAYEIKDSTLYDSDRDHVWKNDNIEAIIDAYNDGGNEKNSNDYKIIVDRKGQFLVQHGANQANNTIIVESAVMPIEGGYALEIYIPYGELGLSEKPEEIGIAFATKNAKINEDGSYGDEFYFKDGVTPWIPNEFIKIQNIEENIDISKEDKKASKDVIAMINRISSNVTIKDKWKIDEARKSYDILTDLQKSLVTNYNKLLKAEEVIEELEG